MTPQNPAILRKTRRIAGKESHPSQGRHGFGHAVSCFIRSFPGQSPRCRRERGMTPIAKSAGRVPRLRHARRAALTDSGPSRAAKKAAPAIWAGLIKQYGEKAAG